MTRRTFADLLNDYSFDVEMEYETLHRLMYSRGALVPGRCLNDEIVRNFIYMPFRGSAISADSFNRRFNLDFEDCQTSGDFDYFVRFCEYVYNSAHGLQLAALGDEQLNMFVIHHIKKVLDNIGYSSVKDGKITVFVENKPEVIEAALVTTPDSGQQLMRYYHYSLKGDIEGKRSILLRLADELEPRRTDLKRANAGLEKDLFFVFNNLDLRHNNTEPGSKNYHSSVARMKASQLEEWYDRTHSMCAEALLALARFEAKAELKNLKENLDA